MQKIILASQSPQRKTLMDALHVKFEVLPSDIDEKVITATTEKERARLIALAKAEKIATENPEAIVIAGDTFTYVDGISYEKPESLEEAKQMLQEQSGKQSVCYTGCAYIDRKNSIEYSGTVETTFIFRDLSEAEIDSYVANNPVMTWSAAFCPAYPEGINMVRAVAGSLSAFSHGIPMEVVIKLLTESGVFK